jgi:cephalosporin hydroxylase
MKSFDDEVQQRIRGNAADATITSTADAFMQISIRKQYSYNFSWLSRPIIQYPQDIVALQEIIWKVRPNLIIETGIAHGGSLILSASMLALLELSGLIEKGQVLGIDIDIRKHNRAAIESHPLAKRITMIEGSSIDDTVIHQVQERAEHHTTVMVILDSNHTHAHVLAELNAYSPLVSQGSYCVVFDTIIEDLPIDTYPDRPWGRGDNPKTAVWKFLKTHPEFMIDTSVQDKLLITVAPDGYLKRI